MKLSDFSKFPLIFALSCFSAFVFADGVAGKDQPLMEIACRYEMKVTPRDKTKHRSSHDWFFWRTSSMIQTQDTDDNHGEIWERTATGGIQYRKLYHDDKTAIEYMPADMPVSNMNHDWFKLSSMLSRQELEELNPVKKMRVLGRAAELRKGRLADQSVELIWLPDENLPASIIRKDKTGTLELRLKEIAPFSTAPWQPVNSAVIADYRHIDAADFGDMENDPFVKKAMAAEGHHHH